MFGRTKTTPDEAAIPEDAPGSTLEPAVSTPPGGDEPAIPTPAGGTEPAVLTPTGDDEAGDDEPGALAPVDFTEPAEPEPAEPSADLGPQRSDRRQERAPGVMIPARSGRSIIETFFMRIVATAGVVGIGTAIAAIMSSQNSKGWVIGMVVSIVTVVLAAILWSSQRL